MKHNDFISYSTKFNDIPYRKFVTLSWDELMVRVIGHMS